MNQDDALWRQVGRLTVLTSDEPRAGRLRVSCRARLARRASQPGHRVGPAVLAGFCLLYLSAVVHDLLRLQGMF